MSKNNKARVPGWLIAVALFLTVSSCAREPADTDTEAGTDAADDYYESEQMAYELLMEMATYVAGIDSFSVRILAGYDVVQEDGQKIQFLEAREVTLARPDHFIARESGAADSGQVVLFDGQTLTVADGDARVYAQAGQPGSVDDTIVYFVRELGMRMPLSGIFTTRFPEELERRVRAIDYVEMSDALAEPAHHLAARTNLLDFQIWIADGDRPLPLRIVITYPDVGLPQYWAEFSDWNLRPQLSEKTFEYEPPSDATKIVFSVQVPPDVQAVPDEAIQESVEP